MAREWKKKGRLPLKKMRVNIINIHFDSYCGSEESMEDSKTCACLARANDIYHCGSGELLCCAVGGWHRGG